MLYFYCHSNLIGIAEKQSTCELEVDVLAADILNRLEVGGKFSA